MTVSQDGLGNLVLPKNVKSEIKYSFSLVHFSEEQSSGQLILEIPFLCALRREEEVKHLLSSLI